MGWADRVARGRWGFLCLYVQPSMPKKEQRGESGNPSEIAASCGNYPKARTKAREAVQSQMKDLLRTPSSGSKQEATSGNDQSDRLSLRLIFDEIR